MLPFRCHKGHQTLENPVIPGFFGPLKLFPLDHLLARGKQDAVGHKIQRRQLLRRNMLDAQLIVDRTIIVRKHGQPFRQRSWIFRRRIPAHACA